jgi:RimJ/RimL family protein N-acetyltransferase
VGAAGAVEAFAIVHGVGDPHGVLYLKRVVVAQPGFGLGGAFLSRVLDEAVGALSAHRFWLDCFADNARAQRAYAKLGFAREGLLREAYRLPDGTRKDLVVMALLKTEWQAKRS